MINIDDLKLIKEELENSSNEKVNKLLLKIKLILDMENESLIYQEKQKNFQEELKKLNENN